MLQNITKKNEDMTNIFNGSQGKAKQAEAVAYYLIEIDDDRIANKWGPAGCFKYEEGKFLFFGFASL